jgi:hypothetical protein
MDGIAVSQGDVGECVPTPGWRTDLSLCGPAHLEGLGQVVVVDVRFEDIPDTPLFRLFYGQKVLYVALRIDNHGFAMRGNQVTIITQSRRDKYFVVHGVLLLLST